MEFSRSLPEHIPVVILIRELSCRFGDVREIFGILKKVTLLCPRAMWEMFWLFSEVVIA